MCGRYINLINISPGENTYVISVSAKYPYRKYEKTYYVCIWNDGYDSWYSLTDCIRNATYFSSEEEARDFIECYFEKLEKSNFICDPKTFKVYKIALEEMQNP